MITIEELERIKQGDGLAVESNGIRHYGASEVLIKGHRLTEVLEAAEAYGESADSPVEIPERKTCPHCGRSHVITTKVITSGGGKYSEAETDKFLWSFAMPTWNYFFARTGM